MRGLTDGLSDYDRRRLQSAMRSLVETGADALEVARAAVWTYGPDRDRLHRVHLYHRSSREHVAGGELRREQYPAYFEALDEDPVVAASDVHRDSRTAGLSDTYAAPLGLTSWLDVPLAAGSGDGEPRGIVRFEQLGPRRRWSDAEITLARGLGAALGAVLTYFEARREPSAGEPETAPAPREEPPPPPAASGEPETAPAPREEPPPPPAAAGEPEGRPPEGSEPPPEEPPPEAREGTGSEERAEGEFLAWRSPAGMALVTRDGAVLSCNPAMAQMLGNASPTELEGASLRRRLPRADDWDDMVERLEREGRVDGWELRIQRPDGSRAWLLLGAVGADGRGGDLLVLSAVNITERKNVEERLERLANRDPLTGAANRRLLQEAAENTLALADRHGRNAALLYVDLRHFKDVNDNFGHEIGDRVLTHVADRLRARGRESDLTARIGGDEFAVLLAEVEGREGARKAAERFLEALRPPIKVDDLTVQVEVTIGVAIYPEHARDVRSLLRLADQAMYRGKEWESGRIVVWNGDPGQEEPEDYGPEVAAPPGETPVVAASEPGEPGGDGAGGSGREDAPPGEENDDDRFLADALEEDRLDLHWQPIQQGTDGAVVGAEALLRWQHPERGWVRAREFVGRAEELGWIRSFDRWVLDRAAGRVKEWQRAGRVEWVALNVSPHSLLSSEYVGGVFERVQEGCLEPGAVLLQVTVDLERHPASEVGRRLAELRQAGFGTALDLTGQTDELVEVVLSALRLDVLEVSPDFLRRMEGRKLGRAVGQARKERGLRLLAKKVENESQHRQAREFGCELIQGLYVGRPVLAEEIGEARTA